MEIVIRSYSTEDLAGVTALWQLVFPSNSPWNIPEEDIQRKLRVQPDLFLVAILDDTLVGTTMAGFDGHRGWVYYVAVHPDYRRKGIGSALMEKAEKGLAAIGCSKINLQVRAGNSQVAAFYRQLGYQVEERISMGKRLVE
jgi:ribosomal protein S18 acetylase RimI-like enzyme